MSIIYEALKKTQKKRQIMASSQMAEPKASPKIRIHQFQRLDLIDGAIVVLLISLLMAIAYQWQQRTHGKKIATVSAKPVAKVIAPPKIDLVSYKQNHLLNGTFISKSDSFALINNKPFHLGDTVDGFKVVDLQLNYVKLKNDENVIILKS